MNPEVEKQVLKYLIELAESPPVQAEIQAARVAILNIIEAEAVKAVPWGLRTITRVMRWIYKKLKGDAKIMSGILVISVKNSAGTVLEGATVNLTGAGTATGTTDANGQLTVINLIAGTYTAAATLDGYTESNIDVTVADDATVNGEITLTAESTEETATGSATITVKDSDGNALEGVALAYTVNSSACDGTTDSNGQLAVTDLPVGTYSFAATLAGYASGSVDVTVTDGAMATGEITMTIETTEEESNVSNSTDVSSAAETAAITSVISSVTSGATEFLERLFTLAETEATRLEAEVTSTTDFFVACRDKVEAVALRALIAAGRAGEVAAVALLVSKLKNKISE